MMSWFLGGVTSLLVASAIGSAPLAVAPQGPQRNVMSSSPHPRPLGGLQLAFEPRSAEVYVDGDYVGVVDEFSGYYQHLDLPAGRHYVEVLANGYQPWDWDVTIVPGRTLTFRMSLEQASHGW